LSFTLSLTQLVGALEPVERKHWLELRGLTGLRLQERDAPAVLVVCQACSASFNPLAVDGGSRLCPACTRAKGSPPKCSPCMPTCLCPVGSSPDGRSPWQR